MVIQRAFENRPPTSAAAAAALYDGHVLKFFQSNSIRNKELSLLMNTQTFHAANGQPDAYGEIPPSRHQG